MARQFGWHPTLLPSMENDDRQRSFSTCVDVLLKEVAEVDADRAAAFGETLPRLASKRPEGGPL